GSQVDLLPTIIGRLGLTLPAGVLHQGCSLDEPAGKRLIYLNSYQQYAVVSGNKMIFGDREREGRGGGRCGQAFIIENEGAKTIFRPVSARGESCPSIRRFDAFQEDLLRNYSYYSTL